MKTNAPHPRPCLPLSLLAAAATALAALAPPPSASAGAPPSPASPDAVKLSAKADQPLIHRAGIPREIVVRIEVEAGSAAVAGARQRPLNLAVVLDRSGSMTGAKIEQARQAAEMLLDRLGPDDVFSLVTYDSEVEVLVPPQRISRNVSEIRRRIRGVEPRGATALYAGVEIGGRQLAEFFDAEGINRVLLLSDGIANVGPSSNREIADLGQRLAREGRSVTTIGLGQDYNEELMSALAEASDANYYYVADAEALPAVFESELGEIRNVVARGLVLEIVFPEGVEPLGFLGRPETISDRRGEIAFGTLAAGQNREVFVSCRVAPGFAEAEAQPVVLASLRYDEAGGRSGQHLATEAAVRSVEDAKAAEGSRVAAITAQAEVYRNAEVTERVIALSDSGRVEEAKSEVYRQIGHLRHAQIGAPSAQADAIEREIRVLEEGQEQLGEGGFTPHGRKLLQWNHYNRVNSKELDAAKPEPTRKP